MKATNNIILLEQQCTSSIDVNISVGKWLAFLPVRAVISCNLKFSKVSLCSDYWYETSTETWVSQFPF